MWRILLLGAVVVLRLSGVVVVGFVATGSMEPAIPQGSLFLGLPTGGAGVGDVVVYEHPDGRLVVHRVVDVRPDGLLVTQGDANAVTDQETGVPPVDPRGVKLVPEIGGHAMALRGEWVKAGFFFLAEVYLLVTLAKWGLASKKKRARTRRWLRMRTPHILAGGAFVLLLTSPFLHKTVESEGLVGLTAPPLPSWARVETAAKTEHHFLWPFERLDIKAVGPVEVTWVPALPGARTLSAEGASIAMLPLLVLLLAGAVVAREWGV